MGKERHNITQGTEFENITETLARGQIKIM
jgi:hypothetical protein